MFKIKKKKIIFLLSLINILTLFTWVGYSPKVAYAARTSPLIINHNSATLSGLSTDNINSAKSHYRIFYGHTSHGSQIVSGMSTIEGENSLYSYHTSGSESGSLYISENTGADLGHSGDLGWVDITREALASDSSINMVMWSWCAGVSDNTTDGINAYLSAMNQLESEYPNVTFVYMTGHLYNPDYGVGSRANTDARNEQIRSYARANNKVLFDFADIESYDPDGGNHAGDTDACNWCSSWCSSHSCPSGTSCAHSHCFNCYRKGQAFWNMMAQLAGGSGSVDNMAARLSGRILLQTEENGEAWYVYPSDLKRYYLGRPMDAWNIMRSLGLGVTNVNLAKIPTYNNNIWSADKNIIDRVRGKILIQVEAHGEAWYVSPVNNRRYYMGRPADAFQLMRNLGLGISNDNLEKIEIGEIE